MYGKGSDSEKLVREVEQKQLSDNWKLRWLFCSKSINQVCRFAKVIEERNYIVSFCSLELLDNTFTEKFDSFCVFRTI